jgi:hypothetical protein
MKTLRILPVLGIPFVLWACQNKPAPDNFSQETHRTYNSETGSFEQSPPFGKQSDKPTDGPQ